MRRSDRNGGNTLGALVRRSPIMCESDTTVGEAANRMADERTSAILVRRGMELGIVTDRDLRSRVVAAGLGSQAPVGSIATFPAHTVPGEASVTEAILAMLEHAFHHLPVVARDGSVLGVIEETDLLESGPRTPFTLIARIDRAGTVDEAVEAARGLPDTVADLVDALLDPVEIGHVIGMTFDALTRKLLERAIAELGSPAVPWAWLALGSLARHEQALHTDQDHAIAYDPEAQDLETIDRLLQRIAVAVTDGLERAGMPRCRAGIVAENRGLRRPVMAWADAFRRWMADEGWMASGVAAIVFDQRRVAGSLDVEPVLGSALRASLADGTFLVRLTENAVRDRPPIGSFRRFVVERQGPDAGRLDLKVGGILAITAIARVYALSIGSPERRTLDRLRAAETAGRIDARTRAGLDEAFRLLWRLRLEHQVARARAGREPDDLIDPRELAPVARSGLREAFRVITRAQHGLMEQFS